jgi:hypothetical protein
MVFFLQAAVSSGAVPGASGVAPGHWWPLGGALVSCTSACIFFCATATEMTLLSAMEDLEIIAAATSALVPRSRQTPSIAWHPSAIRDEGKTEEVTLSIGRL